MDSLVAWLSVPAHYTPILMVIYSLIEYVVGKSSLVKPNSVLDVVLHIVTGRVGEILAKQGVEVPKAETPPEKPVE
jgi:hypothetical protein